MYELHGIAIRIACKNHRKDFHGAEEATGQPNLESQRFGNRGLLVFDQIAPRGLAFGRSNHHDRIHKAKPGDRELAMVQDRAIVVPGNHAEPLAREMPHDPIPPLCDPPSAMFTASLGHEYSIAPWA